MPQIHYYDSERKPKKAELGISDVKAAQAQGVTLTSYMNAKYNDYNPELGSVIRQATNSQGIYLKDDDSLGVSASSLDVCLGNTATHVPLMASSLDGTAAGTPLVAPTQPDADTGLINRILFGENILTMVEEHITDKRNDMIANAMGNLVAVRQSFPDGLFVQPLINTTDAEDVEGLYGASTQNTRPTSMVGISLSQTSQRIPSYSIGLEITDQARSRISFDLLSTIIGAHARGLRFHMMYKDLNRIVNGNPMAPTEGALPTFTATSLDTSIANAPMELTDKSWYGFLFDDAMINSYDMIICGKEEFRAIINRSGRPVNPSGGYTQNNFTTSDPVAINLLRANVPNVLIVKDGTFPAGTIVGIDTASALGEARDSSANYQGSADDRIIRNQQFRWDWSRLLYRLSLGDSPFRVMTLT